MARQYAAYNVTLHKRLTKMPFIPDLRGLTA